MKIAIRVDGNIEIGVGHVFRCITLANKLIDYKIECTFFVRNISKNLFKILDEKFEVILLDCIEDTFEASGEYSRWLGVSQEFDAAEFLMKAEPTSFLGVVVDHYGLGSQWELAVQESFSFLLVLDDLANREHSCDLLVDQSIGRKSSCYSNLVPTTCNLLIGPKFALLRDEFSHGNRELPKKYHILINFGGSDKDNYTEHVLNVLAKSPSIHNYCIKIT